jgi:hypothetical protein
VDHDIGVLGHRADGVAIGDVARHRCALIERAEAYRIAPSRPTVRGWR